MSNVDIRVNVIGKRFALTFVPQILLWNPYDVDLQPAYYVLELCMPCNDPVNTIGLTLLRLNNTQHVFLNLTALI
jgi:hypothetical protein